MRYYAIKKYNKVPKEEWPSPDFPGDYPYATVNLGKKNYYNNPDFTILNEVEYKYYMSNVEQLFWTYQENLEKTKRDYNKGKAYVKEIAEFKDGLIHEFVLNNIFLGISQRGLTNHVRKTLEQVTSALNTYSLKDAIEELIQIDPMDLDDTVLTASRLLEFRNKIEDFIGVPRGTQWNGPKTW